MILKEIIIFLIRIYQKTLSPDHGFLSPFFHYLGIGCRFYPSCSEYAKEAIIKKGLILGIFLALKRVLRCNSRNGGFDPLT